MNPGRRRAPPPPTTEATWKLQEMASFRSNTTLKCRDPPPTPHAAQGTLLLLTRDPGSEKCCAKETLRRFFLFGAGPLKSITLSEI